MSSAYWMSISDAKPYGDLFYTPQSLPHILLIAKKSSDSKAISNLPRLLPSQSSFQPGHLKWSSPTSPSSTSLSCTQTPALFLSNQGDVIILPQHSCLPPLTHSPSTRQDLVKTHVCQWQQGLEFPAIKSLDKQVDFTIKLQLATPLLLFFAILCRNVKTRC